ncbi:MAG: Ubiquinone/menaquinone biosynthesis C-methyltransferase UbiE [Chlamydiae bacterium]|nr:Ubiquinone/menaquinone biosynthesis C-methyltransferase UbiE [Chlamydiota bacterium]
MNTKHFFSSIAKRYDFANTLLSLGFHHLWNRKLLLSLKGATLLDFCAGTGAISKLALKRGFTKVVLVDFCEKMLGVAKQTLKKNAEFICANVENIPLNQTFDHITMAYGIRNVQHPQKCFNEAFRLLKPGGSIALLELTKPKNPLLRFFHWIYLHTYLPLIGNLITKNKEAYSYLSSSILAFDLDRIKVALTHTGFSEISIKSQTFGLATIIIAKKSLSHLQNTP